MSATRNKEVVRRNVEEVYNHGNVDLVDEAYAPMAQLHDPMLINLPAGPAGVKQFARTLRDAFPDFHLHIDDLIAEGDVVAMRWHCTGTHRNTFLGIPATNRFAHISGTGIHRFANDRIVETWLHWDVPAMLRAMGVEIPGMTGAELHT